MKLLESSCHRPLHSVPRIIIVLIIVSLTLQISWHKFSTATDPNREYLSSAPEFNQLQILAMGEQAVLAKLLMLWLQSFDNQPGISLPLQVLDYKKVISWLEQIDQLDNKSHYSLFSAAYIYANIHDEKKQRMIFDYIEKRFKSDPNRYWRWLAHASIQARHRLDDMDLALYYAQALRTYATGSNVPAWARQMEIGILEEKGEYESAKLLIGGLLSEIKITDPYELKFLNTRLKQLRDKQKQQYR